MLHEDRRCASLASQAALAELQLVDELMSIYRDSSQVSLLNRVGRLSDPHPYLRQVLLEARPGLRAKRRRVRRDGSAALERSYSNSKSTGIFPALISMAAAREKVGYRSCT